MSNIDLNYLKYFYYVATLNGFTKAADVLHVQQPVISRAVKLLEEQLGFKLLERQKKKTLLTIEGKEVFKLAEKIFSHVEQIATYAKERSENISGDLCIATSDSLSPVIMGQVLKEFSLQYPQVKLVHHSAPATKLLESLQSGEIEFGIFFNVPPLPDNLSKTKVGQSSFKFVVAKKFVKNQKILNSFIASKELDHSHQDRLPLFQKYKEHNKHVSITGVSSSSIARKAMAMNGLGVTILPSFLIHDELANGSLISINDEHINLPLYIVERNSSYKSKMKNDLLKIIKDKIENI